MQKRAVMLAAVALAAALGSPGVVRGSGAAGTLDPTFGIGGRVTTDFIGPNTDVAQDVLIQSDGKIVVAGHSFTQYSAHSDVGLARLNTDGTLDTTFGIDGYVTSNLGRGMIIVNAAALQSDDKIIVAGSASPSWNPTREDVALARFMPDGSIDPSFGVDGVVITDFGSTWDRAFGVAIGADGRIVVAGRGAGTQFLVARYGSDGSLDPSFGSGGYVTPGFAVAHDVAVQTDGRVIVAGVASGAHFNDFALVRLTASGALDPTFGSGGRVTTDFDDSDVAYALTIQPDGKVLAAGYAHSTGMAVARYATNGALDPSFSGDGKVIVGTRAAYAYDVTVQPSGKIVLGGVQHHPASFAAARLNADGTIDKGFGGGFVTTNVGSLSFGSGVAGQADGTVVLAGEAWGASTGPDFGITRFTDTGQLDDTFDDDGIVTLDFVGPDSDRPFEVLVRSDGKMIVAGYSIGGQFYGDFTLARYHPNGALDTTFGDGGRVRTDLGGSELSRAAALQPDGKIVVAGSVYALDPTRYWDFAVVRYNADGSLDASFGEDGIVITSFDGADGYSYDEARGVALQPDGKIVVAGSTWRTDTGEDYALVRYNADGSVDASFGDEGRVITDFPGVGYYGDNGEGAHTVVVDSRGRLVVAGGSNTYSAAPLKIARYTQDGRLDPSFGSGGFLEEVEVFDVYESGRLIALTPDDGFVAAGIVASATDSDLAVVRYTARGTPDPSFGSGGRATIDLGVTERVQGLTVQPHGKIIVSGSFRTPPTYADRRAIARLTRDGVLDDTFGEGGLAATGATSFGDGLRALATLPNGKIVAAGSMHGDGTAEDFVVERYEGIGGPADAAAGIIGQLLALSASDVLNQGQTQGLRQKIDAAIAALEAGRPDAAARDLEAFVRHVEAFGQAGVLGEAEASAFIDAAEQVIDAIA